ncbi:MAG: transcriptional regulator FilR1 domain-containing protein [Methanobrevibacter sp.]|uniref:transcriptional regulator FilR1 domain-containing protein n=1 Tax=Methanobrevibacter sp. TaxID=66852 RepID=UPI003F1281E0
MINLENNKNYLKSYDSISEEIKYLTNSIIRLKILAALYKCPLNMKDINSTTSLSYSSISSNLHNLELKGIVYREHNKYFLSNSSTLEVEQVLRLSNLLDLLNDFFNILDKHLVDVIPNQSVIELYLIGNAHLIESDGVDAYRIYKFIEEALESADEVKCILPFYHETFNDKLNKLVKNNKKVEVIIPHNLLKIFNEKSEIENLSFFKEEKLFLLINTNESMILGLFKEDGSFDQNRLLTSKNSDSIKWANNLYENFKNKNK